MPPAKEKPFKLDLSFEEALRRIAQTDLSFEEALRRIAQTDVAELRDGARLAQKQKQRDKKRAERKKASAPPKG